MDKSSEQLGRTAAKAGIWYTVGNILLKGCVFLSLPIFTRLLSTDDFGIYNAYIAYEQILSAILGLGLYGTVKNAKIEFPDKFNQYLSSVLSLSIGFSAIIFLLANLLYPFYAEFIGFSRFTTNCLFFQSFGSYLLFFYGAKLNIEFKYKSYLGLSFFNIVGNIFISIILIVYVFPNEKYLGRIFGSALPLIIIAFFICIYIFHQGKMLYSNKFWKYALAIGIPLIPHVVSQSLLSQFARVMIKDMVGTSEAGIYSYIFTLCTILFIVGNSFENAWTPWVFLTLKENKEDDVRKASKNYIAFFSLLTIGFMCVMPEVTKLVAGEEYWGGINLIVPLSLGNYFIFLYTLPANIEYYHKKTAYISAGTVLTAIINILLNYVFIKIFGYKSAAYTTMVSYILLFVFHWIIAKKYRGNKIYSLKIIMTNIFIVLVSGCVLLLVSCNPFLSVLLRYIIIFGILLILFLKRNMISSMLRRNK
ncbi:MAG: oligosaccharide flippase family protein [Oscillospiraceae bacterium]|jgi:O-antigen/teichoic acid export membrane protein|nr:oligosaccharide flippase family protein [Oscillospiraceae bacterium]